MGDLERDRKDRGALVPTGLLDPVVAFFDPRRVILFGSLARGEAVPDSDIDLLVVVDDDTAAEKVTLHAGIEARRGYRRPADVFPVTEETFHRKCGLPGTLARAALLGGVTVYEQVPVETSGTEADPADLRDSVLEWLRVAQSDIHVARACLGNGTAGRYPDMAQLPPEPSAEELSAALEHITRLADALEAEIPPG